MNKPIPTFISLGKGLPDLTPLEHRLWMTLPGGARDARLAEMRKGVLTWTELRERLALGVRLSE